MFDLFRFTAAILTSTLLVHVAWNIARVIVLIPLALILMPLKRYGAQQVEIFLTLSFRYYVTSAFIAVIIANWSKSYPHLSTWLYVVTFLVMTGWMVGNYGFRIGQLSTFRSRVLEPNAPIEVFEDYELTKKSMPWYFGASVLGLVQVLMAMIAPRLFQNGLIDWLGGWQDRFQELPVIPLLFAVYGFWLAIVYTMKAVMIPFVGASVIGEGIRERKESRAHDEEIRDEDDTIASIH